MRSYTVEQDHRPLEHLGGGAAHTQRPLAQLILLIRRTRIGWSLSRFGMPGIVVDAGDSTCCREII